ncbi:MAG TPA: hypothetical protein PKN87_04875 [Syntrophomonadaceae bacterium]|nr:hypothetical protein [Syntrophomonadaceae bacterium]HPR92827.1 hypothetical protein [Syntrophomonadaceae bacterium]
MILEPTVFILGAGASKPYGFPTGIELKYKALKTIEQNKEDVFGELGYKTKLRDDFCEALRHSGRASVDAFLEHRTDFLDIGKLAIAASLIPLEEDIAIYGDAQIQNNSDHWYQFIFNKMNTSFEGFSQNNISFITFNYDRSLEHYLFTCLKNGYGKTIKESALIANQIKIIHLHGNLGYLPWQDNNTGNFSRPYSRDWSVDTIYSVASQIKIIHEDIANDPEFKLAHDKIRDASRVYFLGFGYDKTNLNRLLNGISLDNKTAMGTSLGFTQLEMDQITKTYPILLMVSPIINFFRNLAPLN